MGQKIHPVGFRVGITKKHQSNWFANPHDYSFLILEDRFIRNYFSKRFGGISHIGIYRKSNEKNTDQTEVFDLIKVEINAVRSRSLIQRDGQAIKQIRDELETQLNKTRQKQIKSTPIPATKLQHHKVRIAIQVNNVSNPYSNAGLIADFLVEQLEKRVAFRRALRQALKISKFAGVKLQISGRLNGAEIARTEWIRKGRVPLQTLRANIDYSYRTANTIYGILGIKTWTYDKR